MKKVKKSIATLGGKFSKDIYFELPKEAGERHHPLIDKKKRTPKIPKKKPGNT